MKKLVTLALVAAVVAGIARLRARSAQRLHGTPDHWPPVARKPDSARGDTASG